MKRKRKRPAPVFKEYNQEQPLLLPPSLDELIPTNHVVRTMDRALEGLDLDMLIRRYPGGGSSSYHPHMMLKVLVYAYTQKLYSSRMIAKALREQIPFMWLSGNNRPDFRTINRFRATVMKDVVERVFGAVVELLLAKEMVRFEDYFLDGTKIEADAGKYTFVWRKSVVRNKTKLQARVRELLEHIDEVNERENREYGDLDLEELGEGVEITAAELDAVVERINNAGTDEQRDEGGDDKEELRIIREEYLPRLKKYEEQERICGGRNSYSKTDHDATFLRMKEDPMLNGQLKPGYNVQIGTENQYILGYSIHQRPTDTTTLIPHLEKLKGRWGKLPGTIVADAGYGSEENYVYLEGERVGSYVKYNYFHKEKKRKYREDPFRAEHLEYEAENDRYRCPSGRWLSYTGHKTRVSDTGFKQEYRVYTCEDCRWCRSRLLCHTSKYNRTIEINTRLNELRAKARANLDSEKGKLLRSRRPVEVESVFGHIKHNRGFRRFLLRGIDKVSMEWGLLSIAHNLLKMHSSLA